ncbi:MFS general substrate transporter [Acrodontium crateriforme]|uniref:MFS general substrate transporter n=1 Tax=Acrodontium crateriforme TaxID=150365 RepID=A0AAQ3R799_9PEZI|nr:MFS general substrate transporter [Acrodontium crateriforme]
MTFKNTRPVSPEDYNALSNMDNHKKPGTRSINASMAVDATETSPLLASSSDNDSDQGDVLELHKAGLIHSRHAIMWTVTLSVLLISLADQIAIPPLSRIMESIVCYEYFEKVDPSQILVDRAHVRPGALGGVLENNCKVDAVQSEVANLQGYQLFFDGFPSLLLAVPFGWAADRIGRKPVIMLGLFSFVLKVGWIEIVLWFWQIFDIRLMWLSSLHGLLGGSSPVIVTISFVVLSDVTPSAERAAVFVRLGAVNFVASLVMPPVAAWLMTRNPWIPALLGLLGYALTVMSYIAVPETKDYRAHSSSNPPSPPPEPVPEVNSKTTQESHLRLLGSRWLVQLRNSTAFLTHDYRVLLLIFIFLGHQLIGVASQLLLLYCSKRYDITMAKSTILVTVFSGLKSGLCFFVLPYISNATMKYLHYSTMKKDLYLTRISFALVAAGWTIMGLAPNIPIMIIGMVINSLGAGAYLMIRAYIISLVPAHHVARVLTIASLTETAGSMFGGPLLSTLYERGLHLGGGWVGLPWYFIGILTFVFVGLLMIIRMQPGESETITSDFEDES